jgi:hypothetical protein
MTKTRADDAVHASTGEERKEVGDPDAEEEDGRKKEKKKSENSMSKDTGRTGTECANEGIINTDGEERGSQMMNDIPKESDVPEGKHLRATLKESGYSRTYPLTVLDDGQSRQKVRSKRQSKSKSKEQSLEIFQLSTLLRKPKKGKNQMTSRHYQHLSLRLTNPPPPTLQMMRTLKTQSNRPAGYQRKEHLNLGTNGSNLKLPSKTPNKEHKQSMSGRMQS